MSKLPSAEKLIDALTLAFEQEKMVHLRGYTRSVLEAAAKVALSTISKDNLTGRSAQHIAAKIRKLKEEL